MIKARNSDCNSSVASEGKLEEGEDEEQSSPERNLGSRKQLGKRAHSSTSFAKDRRSNSPKTSQRGASNYNANRETPKNNTKIMSRIEDDADKDDEFFN